MILVSFKYIAFSLYMAFMFWFHIRVHYTYRNNFKCFIRPIFELMLIKANQAGLFCRKYWLIYYEGYHFSFEVLIRLNWFCSTCNFVSFCNMNFSLIINLNILSEYIYQIFYYIKVGQYWILALNHIVSITYFVKMITMLFTWTFKKIHINIQTQKKSNLWIEIFL